MKGVDVAKGGSSFSKIVLSLGKSASETEKKIVKSPVRDEINSMGMQYEIIFNKLF